NITEQIIGLSNAMLGHIRGGLGLANVSGSMLFGGVSGTAVADTASIGSVMIPGMAKSWLRQTICSRGDCCLFNHRGNYSS
ncbi:TRAP transporter large permease subunit, partial [Vibrio sp. D173a]|uniref:TRAP transporter large permease subunit n=1 Tax=Vibrio sp. D173a TaxID=2836349 RepID=UPI002556BD32